MVWLSEVEKSDDVAAASFMLKWEVCLDIGWYQSIAISARISMDVRKRMEVVPLLFDHYIMSSDQKRMVDG